MFTETLSGSAKMTQPGLVAVLGYARAGDIVVVTAIDRLGGSVAEATRIIAELGERRIVVRALREGVDTRTPTGRAAAAIMATLAELELELGRERRASSRDSRRTRWLLATTPPKLSVERQEQRRCLAAMGEPVRELAAHLGLDERPRTATCRRCERDPSGRDRVRPGFPSGRFRCWRCRCSSYRG